MTYWKRTGWRLILAAAAVWAGGASVVRADQVVLKDGDTLTGHIVAMDAGKLTITVLGLGDVKVDAAQIATVSTDGPVELKLKDGTIEKRKLSAYHPAVPSTAPAHGPTSAPTTFPTAFPTVIPTTVTPNQAPAVVGTSTLPGQVVIDGGLVPVPTELGDITQINPPAPAFTGSVTAGALLIRGNASTDTLNLGVNVARKTDQDTVAFTGAYLYGRTRDRKTAVVTTTEENWQIEGRYDYNFTARFYGFLDAQVRKDRIADLDLRFVPSGGLGYKFVNDPDFLVGGELGLAWVYEKYTNNTPTKEDVSGRAAYHILKKFNDSVSVFHDLEYLQSVQRGSNYIVNTDLGVRFQMTKHFFGEAKVTLDFDSAPANGALKSDVFYAVNIGYNL